MSCLKCDILLKTWFLHQTCSNAVQSCVRGKWILEVLACQRHSIGICIDQTQSVYTIIGALNLTGSIYKLHTSPESSFQLSCQSQSITFFNRVLRFCFTQMTFNIFIASHHLHVFAWVPGVKKFLRKEKLAKLHLLLHSWTNFLTKINQSLPVPN